MERLCWIALLILVAWSLAWTLHGIFGGIPADATPGDIWRAFMW